MMMWMVGGVAVRIFITGNVSVNIYENVKEE
jgi:hypothetical protein